MTRKIKTIKTGKKGKKYIISASLGARISGDASANMGSRSNPPQESDTYPSRVLPVPAIPPLGEGEKAFDISGAVEIPAVSNNGYIIFALLVAVGAIGAAYYWGVL